MVVNPIAYLPAIAGATNVGSLATLSSNPQNILIAYSSGITYLDFFRVVAPVALDGLLIQMCLLWLLYPVVGFTKSCEQLSTECDRLNKP